MVGVARIELATPAMSTQPRQRKSPNFLNSNSLKRGTSGEQAARPATFYRSVTARPTPLSTEESNGL